MEENQQKTQYVYILRCGDGTLYTGWTTDLEHRVAMHNAGKGAKYTRARRPVRLEYYEEYMDKKEALRRECAIKKMTRSEKSRGTLLSRGIYDIIVLNKGFKIGSMDLIL